MKTEVKVKKYTCARCNYSWISRITTIPKQCPHCKSPNWDIPKENKVNKNKKKKNE